jgi:hypothetical protein
VIWVPVYELQKINIMQMKESYGGIAEEVIHSFEQKLNTRLPDSYRQFLLSHNGGEPCNYYITVPGWGESLVNNFFGLGFSDYRSLERCLQSWVDVAQRSQTIPIARDPGGNIFLIGIDDGNLDQVYFLDHELFDEEPLLMANSFAEFTANLRGSAAP